MKKKEGFQGQRAYTMPAALLHEVREQPLCQGLYLTDIGYYPKAQFHNRVRKTGIAQFVLVYCVQGEGWYQVHGAARQAVKANQLFLLPAHLAHRYRADDDAPWTIYWLHFAGSEALAFYRHVQGGDLSQPLLISPTEERFQLFEDMFRHLNMSFSLPDIVYANQCLRCFLTGLSGRLTAAEKADDSSDVIARSIAFMSEHLAQNFTLTELAGQAGLSISQYSALFRARTHNAPLTYFNLLKMQKSCQLLANTTQRIKEVAYQLGFTDPYYFSRVFTKLMSMSPRDFRRANKS